MLSALINAGGSSTRMGSPKALLPLPPDDRPLLAHVVAVAAAVVDGPILVVANHPDIQRVAATLPRVTVLPDDHPGQGPLGGLATGLARVPGWALVLACDLPLLRAPLLRLLADRCGSAWDVVMPVIDGRAETLCAAYHPRCLPVIQTMLAADQRRIRDLYAQVRVRYIDTTDLRRVDTALASFTNVNTPQEWAAIRARLEKGSVE